jgi:hypothetical protein
MRHSGESVAKLQTFLTSASDVPVTLYPEKELAVTNREEGG